MKLNLNTIKISMIVLLLLVILVAGVLPLIGGTRTLGLGLLNGQPRQFQGAPQNGMIPPQDGNFPPGQQNGMPPEGLNGIPADGNRNYLSDSIMGGRNDIQMKLLRLVQYGLGGSVLLFGILGIIGLWKDRKWGKVMAIISCVMCVASIIPSLPRGIAGFTHVESIVKAALSAAILVLVFVKQKNSLSEVVPA